MKMWSVGKEKHEAQSFNDSIHKNKQPYLFGRSFLLIEYLELQDLIF